MLSTLPSLASIRAFEAAARLGSFAKAAEELGTSSASVSYHVRQLETQIGARLFIRGPRSVVLTDQGATVAREASDAFARLRAIFMKVSDADAGRLSLTTLPTLATSWLAPKLGEFCARAPAIRVELDLSADAKDLTQGPFDAAVRHGQGRWQGMRAHKLFPSVFMPLCAPSLLKRGIDLTAKTGPGAPLLGRQDWWSLWRRALGGAPFKAEDFGATFPTEHLDAAAAIAGHGVTMGSPILFEDELNAGRLVPAHPAAMATGADFWFTFPLARLSSAKIKAFQDWVREAADASLKRATPYLDNVMALPS